MQRPQHTFHAVGPRHVEPSIRNPWVDRPIESSSSSASRSARSLRRPGYPRVPPAIRAGPPPAADWLRPAQQIRPAVLNNPGPSVQSSSPPESIGGVGGGSDACGGQFAACDTFCYHCLQVMYIAGILTGISLTIAGSVLRGVPRRGDLLVLVYIGVLLAAVCTLLLTVHVLVRRGVKQRKRNVRVRLPPAPQTHVTIPLQDINTFPPLNLRQEFVEVRQQRQPTIRSSTHSSQSRRYYLQERPTEDWDRPSYQPLIHHAPR